jgi:DNA-binding protein H-NS
MTEALDFRLFYPSKPMSKLTALKKQIAALEAQAERIAKEEMSSAIAKVKDIMAEFNLTIEHLTQAVGGKRASNKTKAKAASVAKYADPKTGKTWSGFGRAPGWIAGAKNRDAFLVGKSAAADSAAKDPAAAKKTSGKAAKAVKAARKIAKPAAKKAIAAVKKASVAKAARTTAKSKPAAKKAAAKKSAPKAAASKRPAAASVEASATPAT